MAASDGELDPPAAQKVEARLAADPAFRTRADALKKTFALLDYLPRPEPSPTFTTRTLDRLPAVQSGSGVKAVSAGLQLLHCDVFWLMPSNSTLATGVSSPPFGLSPLAGSSRGSTFPAGAPPHCLTARAFRAA